MSARKVTVTRPGLLAPAGLRFRFPEAGGNFRDELRGKLGVIEGPGHYPGVVNVAVEGVGAFYACCLKVAVWAVGVEQ